MTANMALANQYAEDLETVYNVTESIKSEYSAYFSRMISKTDEEKQNDFKSEYRKLLSQTKMSLKKCINSNYKKTSGIEINEIEQIKAALTNFSKNNDSVNAFKKELINDLTSFQKLLRNKHVVRIADLERQKRQYSEEILKLEAKKTKMIFDKLMNVQWPYDNATKECDTRIAQCKHQVLACTQKIENAQKTKPAANEKDLLLYELKLNEKYSDYVQ
jgi:hypothetical protein